MGEISSVLNKFQPISLKEMDDVALLDRTDTKFTFSDKLLDTFLSELQPDYRVLEVEGNRSTSYETLYYDTKNFDFYLLHHNQKLNRFKARFRKYVESNLVFFEVKFKSNKGRTIKKRVKEDAIYFTLSGKEKELFEKVTRLKAEHFLPQLWVNYKRTTFVSKKLDERLTIDTDLTFREGVSSEFAATYSLTGLVIAEVKQKKISFSSPFVRMMHREHIRKLSMSKYCIGVSSLHPELKNNNFKAKILTINKILHGTNSSSNSGI